jgi:hypothetical protein
MMATIFCSHYNTEAPQMFSILLSKVSHLLRFIVLVQPKSLVRAQGKKTAGQALRA